MEQNIWQFQEAKSKFSQLVDSAIHHKPQFVTKHGSNAVVIISFEDYIKFIKPKDDLVSFFRNSPLAESELDFSRNMAVTFLGLSLIISITNGYDRKFTAKADGVGEASMELNKNS